MLVVFFSQVVFFCFKKYSRKHVKTFQVKRLPSQVISSYSKKGHFANELCFYGHGGRERQWHGCFLAQISWLFNELFMRLVKKHGFIVLPYTVNKWLFLEGSYFSGRNSDVFTKEIVE